MGRRDDSRDDRDLVSQYRRAYADALLAGHPRAAETVIREAIESGLAEGTIDDDVIAPALRTVGDLWAAGRITIGEEHLATSISIRVLALQREAFRVARRRAARRVVLAGAQGELHVVGLQMAASLLVHAGYDVRLLGADLPVSEVGPVVERHRPAVMGFTAATTTTAARLPSAFDAARAADPEVDIVVGGLGVGAGWGQVWGVTVCDFVGDAVPRVDALVQRAAHN